MEWQATFVCMMYVCLGDEDLYNKLALFDHCSSVDGDISSYKLIVELAVGVEVISPQLLDLLWGF